MATINVNGERREVHAPGDTPLLYVLRNELNLVGPQFGCGVAQCGACSVLIDGKEMRSCITALASMPEARCFMDSFSAPLKICCALTI